MIKSFAVKIKSFAPGQTCFAQRPSEITRGCPKRCLINSHFTVVVGESKRRSCVTVSSDRDPRDVNSSRSYYY